MGTQRILIGNGRLPPAFAAVIWLAFIICPNRRVFSLSTPKVVEKLTMALQAELIIPVVVVLNPLDQLFQHGFLILW
jgi:hypothetical protein